MTEDFETRESWDQESLDKLETMLSPGKPIQEAYGLSSQEMDLMCVAATRCLQNEAWTDAERAFLFLCFLDRQQPRHWMGLGESLRGQQRFNDAIEAYEMAALNAEEDPRPHFHWASCLLSTGQEGDALKRLRLAEEYCQGKVPFQSLREACAELIDDLESRKETGGTG